MLDQSSILHCIYHKTKQNKWKAGEFEKKKKKKRLIAPTPPVVHMMARKLVRLLNYKSSTSCIGGSHYASQLWRLFFLIVYIVWTLLRTQLRERVFVSCTADSWMNFKMNGMDEWNCAWAQLYICITLSYIIVIDDCSCGCELNPCVSRIFIFTRNRNLHLCLLCVFVLLKE